MKFHLDHTPKKADFELDHSNGIFLIGSCFAEEIGNKLKEHRFKVNRNPAGILFNPLSIESCLNTILQQKQDEAKIIKRGENYFSYEHHSSVKANSKEELLNEINKTQKEALEFLKEASVLIITFGTAYYYKHRQLDSVVANCHKQASTLFSKELCSVEMLCEKYSELIKAIKSINPKIKFIFTVSPVKYLKDGLENNSISKSTLLLAAQMICAKNKDCHYFPAFELVNDDLRDHRFYKEDLAHPNEQAINYVWEKFSVTFFSEGTKKVIELLSKLNVSSNHHTLHNNKEETIKLEEYCNKLKENIKELVPGIEF